MKKKIKNIKIQEILDNMKTDEETKETEEINEAVTNIKKYYKKISELDKKLIYNYDYTYYDLMGETLVPNENWNEKYGSTRKGYELFSKDNSGLFGVGYSGQVSLRELYLRDSLELVGYITEAKKPIRPYLKEAADLYEETLNYFKEVLEVEDEDSFKYYIEENGPGYDLYNKDRVQTEVNKIGYLVELMEQYFEDEKFKKFFDKIIK